MNVSPASAPKTHSPAKQGETLLEVHDLVKHFPIRGGVFSRVREWVKAVNGVSFSLGKARTLGLVGESGCGKTTVGRTLLRLVRPTSGRVLVRRTFRARLAAGRAARAAAANADHLPGSLRFAQSAHDRRRHRRRAVVDPRFEPGRRTAGPRARSY